MAIIGEALAAKLIEAGFELLEVRQGKHITVYDFEDSPALEEYLSFDINWKL